MKMNRLIPFPWNRDFLIALSMQYQYRYSTLVTCIYLYIVYNSDVVFFFLR